MGDLIVKWLAEIGTVARVYTEVDYYVYIKAVEYLICIGFFVIYNLFWKNLFKPDHWAKSSRVAGAVGIVLLAGLVFAGPAAAASAPPGAASQGPPASVVIDPLARLYLSVTFDHAMHADMVGDCASCHHHTTGAAPAESRCAKCHEAGKAAKVVSCRGCHSADPFTAVFLQERPADLYHIDKPGLKGAYHLGCIGCHQEMGGPTGCRECHPLAVEGEGFYHLDAKGGEKP